MFKICNNKVFIDKWKNNNFEILKYSFYEPPTKNELNKIKKYNIVKISNQYESFWVQILYIKNYLILGKIDDYLNESCDYNYNNYVVFTINNIFNIL